MSYFGSIGRKTVRIMVTIGTPVSTVLLSTKTPVRNFFCQKKGLWYEFMHDWRGDVLTAYKLPTWTSSFQSPT